jgi:3-carboxy-cis,cis-muconate cycloisomerase
MTYGMGPVHEPRNTPFSLLHRLHADPVMDRVFSQEASLGGWLRVEAALARAQANVGLIGASDADAIAGAAASVQIESNTFWAEAGNVGYPILPLVRSLAAELPPGPDGRVHYGATTQDIMDTALALQLVEAVDRLDGLVCAFGDALAVRIAEHAGTVMAARTHAQQAVPTTLGCKLSTYLGELLRHRERLAPLRERAGTVSLFGAGGTNAAMGPKAPAVRSELAALLGLTDTDVPWHTSRDTVAEFGLMCAQLAGTCARFAREVVDLSRTEIAEVREGGGHHRGASSTMPQKENPISSEAIIGMAVTAGALTSAFIRIMEAGHERAAGEWQAEWEILPQAAGTAAGALALAADTAASMRVFPDAMTRNLTADGGLLMAEAHMMRLAPALGREAAHDLVYAAAQQARAASTGLLDALMPALPPELAADLAARPVAAADCTGEAEDVSRAAAARWTASRPA